MQVDYVTPIATVLLCSNPLHFSQKKAMVIVVSVINNRTAIKNELFANLTQHPILYTPPCKTTIEATLRQFNPIVFKLEHVTMAIQMI